MTKNSKKVLVKAKFTPAIPSGYKDVLKSIIDKIKAARTRAMIAVNRELVEVSGYWKNNP